MTDQKPADTTANPAPLGLLGFGMTTVLLNLHNIGFFPIDSMILAMGIFYGGIAQIIAGIMEWKKGNTFGTTAFTSYGFFWLTLVGTIVLPHTDLGITAPITEASMAMYLILWGIFTMALFLVTCSMNRVIQMVFALLTILFLFLAMGDALNDPSVKAFAGWEGVLCGALAMYAGFAQIMNEQEGEEVWPLGAITPTKKKKKAKAA